MKNIHILPTDKPSRLTKALHYNNELRLVHKDYQCDTKDEIFQNIYITSDEEIKDGDWFYLDDAIIVAKYINVKPDKEAQKIILTTDQDLIKDGVQAIPDEFLEWFVKNPSCEEVKVYKDKRLEIEQDFDFYEIIIPKEEPKQELRGIPAGTINMVIGKPKQETLEQIDQNNLVTRGSTALIYKQETLEEVAEIGKFAEKKYLERLYSYQKVDFKDGVFEGAKWQQEQDMNKYSEEEVLELLQDFANDLSDNVINIKFWFNKFKKK